MAVRAWTNAIEYVESLDFLNLSGWQHSGNSLWSRAELPVNKMRKIHRFARLWYRMYPGTPTSNKEDKIATSNGTYMEIAVTHS
jgi:hypothetical protein